VSDHEHERWYAGLEGRADRVLLAVETRGDGRHIGNVWLWDIDTRHRKAEVRVVIGAAAARGRGQGSEAIDLLSRYAFDRLNLHRTYAYVLASNAAALRAFEKAGFKLEGVLREDRWDGGRYVDVHLLGRLASGS
jgi:ribosomal-protein-alanine N-acetyltransferase